MPNSDTQNDTSALHEQVESFWFKAQRWEDLDNTPVTVTQTPKEEWEKELLALIAQREQAAELRGRIDELNDVIGGTAEQDRTEHMNWYLSDRLATLQERVSNDPS